MAKRSIPEINAASMADIAFMLLIFFLVATTMDIDTGLSRTLPPEDKEETSKQINERNIFEVLVNKEDDLLVEGELLPLDMLREKTIEFLTNPQNNADLPEKTRKEIEPFGEVDVTKGVISLQNDHGTSYEMYLQVLNELVAAGTIVRDQFCFTKLGMKYEDINDSFIKDAVQNAVPLMISEAEPKKIGGN